MRSAGYVLLFYLSIVKLIEPNRDQATSADNSTNYRPLDFATDVSLHAAKRPSA
jgi:hypothetical protein